ncbi:hypothetical protein F4677DRAFT_161819 [Hypoxylon crocopeplum]|nr:hypothetical protein F4677DRAFT_161819 [Hypoxylon crocopeplum]
MTLEDWLDDLCVRFIINLPRADLSSVARICFQIEEAQWFYEDFIRPLDPTLPSMSLRSFSLRMFQHCPLLASFSAESHIKAFEEFMQYKTRVPVRGAVMLNDNMDAAVLVRGYKKGASWSFPRGKINKDEDDLDCAVREVYEETGFDLRESGLVAKNQPVHPLEVTMHDQQVRLYVFRGIPEDTVFETRTRKEIGAIRWYRVEELPAYRKKKGPGKNNGVDGPSKDKFYMVAPFMVQLRQWVIKQKNLDSRKISDSTAHHHLQSYYEDTLTDDNMINEPIQDTSAPAHPELIDNATRELQRLLKVQPPTQGLQISSPTSSQAGQTLMSLLQPRTADEQPQGVANTEFGQSFTDVPQLGPPHYHHHPHHPPEQPVPIPTYRAPPQFSMEASQNVGYSQQHRARPYVNVSTEVPNPPAFSEQLHQFRNQTVQLVHPQPLPPQVQKAMLLRGMASSPQVTDPTISRPGPSGLSQENQHVAQVPQTHLHGTYGAHVEKRVPAQLSAHSANLLNVFKGSAAPANTSQRLDPESPRQPANMPAQRNHQAQFPSSGNGFASQYGSALVHSSLNTMPVSSQSTSVGSNVPPTRPTDKHRAGLLDMFKVTEATVSAPRNQLDEEGEKKQHYESSSTTSTIRATARENGRPVVMNPETNLPFGAVRILSRPRASETPAESPSVSARITTETARHSNMGSLPSPSLSFNKPSPSITKAPSRSHQLPPQRPQQLGRLSPRAYTASMQSYPYGTSPGSAPNPLSLFPGPPSASALPIPGGLQFRQDSTTEQRNNLLSLFGKTKSSLEQSKGKEPAMVDQFGPGAAPRSRLGSVASSGGDGMQRLRGNASRRGSQTPLSPADREFLMNFLESASGGARR